MVERPSSDTEFEDYLSGKTPLSRSYQNLPDAGPSQTIDDAILNAARNEVSKKHSGASNKGYNWYVPAALAASIFIAIGVLRIYSNNSESDLEQIAGNNDHVIQSDITAASKSSPERMLDRISYLIEKSEMDLAKEQYQAFSELFPNHKIDFKKYPNLKSISQSR